MRHRVHDMAAAITPRASAAREVPLPDERRTKIVNHGETQSDQRAMERRRVKMTLESLSSSGEAHGKRSSHDGILILIRIRGGWITVVEHDMGAAG